MMTVNKMIGFRLTGHVMIRSEFTDELEVDSNQRYEIEIFPTETSSASLIHLKKNETKSIVLDLPQEMKEITYEQGYVFLLQNDLKLVVSVQGYEKLRNRKLLVEFGHSLHACAVNVEIIVYGCFQNYNYKIYLNPLDINLSIGEIQEIGAGEYLQIPIEFGEMVGLKDRVLKKIFQKLNGKNFHVEVDRGRIKISLGSSLTQFISNPNLLYPSPSRMRAKQRVKQEASGEQTTNSLLDKFKNLLKRNS